MNILKLKYVVLFSPVIISYYLFISFNDSNLPTSPKSNPLYPFNYYVLSFSWPNAYCKQKIGQCKLTKPTPPQEFTIHGLWPSRYKARGPENCEPLVPVDPTTLNDLVENDGLGKYWPNLQDETSLGFWEWEWTKHGNCSGKEPKEYFKTGISYGKNYAADILRQMNADGIVPNDTKQYDAKNVLDSIKKVTTKDAMITCNTDSLNKFQLSKIRLCVTRDAKQLEDCHQPPRPSCNKPFLFATTKDINTGPSSIEVYEDEDQNEDDHGAEL